VVLAGTSLIDADARSNDTAGQGVADFGGGGGYGGNGGKHSGESDAARQQGVWLVDAAAARRRRHFARLARRRLGGGLIDIVALADVRIDGDVSASGGRVRAVPRRRAGSGSGGGIALRARDIGGTGKVRATGGASVAGRRHRGARRRRRRRSHRRDRFTRLNASLGFDVSGGSSTGQAGGSGTLYVRNADGSLDEVRFIGQFEAVSGSRNADAGTPWPDGVVPGAYIRNKFLTPTDEAQQVLNTTGNLRIENGLLTANAIRLIVGGSLFVDNRTVITVQGKGPEYNNSGVAWRGRPATRLSTARAAALAAAVSAQRRAWRSTFANVPDANDRRSQRRSRQRHCGRTRRRSHSLRGRRSHDDRWLSVGDGRRLAKGRADWHRRGAGGSIWIEVGDVVNGTGVISANGGSAASWRTALFLARRAAAAASRSTMAARWRRRCA
jgi:hypothetical protein